MDLKEAWKKLEQEKLTQPVAGAEAVYKTSKHPVQKLIRSFQLALGFVVLFELAFAYLAIVVPQPIVKVAMVLMMIVYIFYFVSNYQTLQHIKNTFRMDQNLAYTLQSIYDNTQRSLKFQRKSAVFIYPLAATCGFLLGLSIESNVAELLERRSVWISLLITIVVLTPISYFVAIQLERLGYCRYLDQLRALIHQLNPQVGS
jgi:ABC-type siderophore export system fused ATPase/permease subunit